MGGVMMSLLLSRTISAEIFMLRYLNKRGHTPYTMDLIPGGALKKADSPAVMRHKFREALKRQKQLLVALRHIEEDDPAKCKSRFMNKINIYTYENKQDAPPKLKEYKYSKDKERASMTGFGNLDKLVRSEGRGRRNSEIQVEAGVSSEEIVREFHLVKRAPTDPQLQRESLRGSAREKRSRSRPEPGQRKPGAQGQRQTMSVTQVRKESDGHVSKAVREAPSQVLVETSGCPKKSKKGWPVREAMKSILKDQRNRPTSVLLARFRPSPSSEYVEVEYSFNKNTGQDFFRISSGALENLLFGDQQALALYLSDKKNNNLDDKSHFFKNVPHFFNNLEGRIWWNGFIANLKGEPGNRMNLKRLKMHPPTMIFQVNGLKRVRAVRHRANLVFRGTTCDSQDNFGMEHGDEPNEDQIKELVIRGRTEREAKQLDVEKIPDTTFVRISLPTLSGIPVSTTGSGATMNQEAVNTEAGLGIDQEQEQPLTV